MYYTKESNKFTHLASSIHGTASLPPATSIQYCDICPEEKLLAEIRDVQVVVGALIADDDDVESLRIQ